MRQPSSTHQHQHHYAGHGGHLGQQPQAPAASRHGPASGHAQGALAAHPAHAAHSPAHGEGAQPPQAKTRPHGAKGGQRRNAKQAARHSQDYTLIHGGRQVRLGPVAFWIVVGTLVVMGTWTISTATYFAFRDDVLTRLIARQADMQYAYEDRIADLRGQVDRISSRQLLDQEQYEQKLDLILRRQSVLESRASAIGSLPDAGVTGSVRPALRSSSVMEPALPKAAPVSDRVTFVAPPENEARLQSRTPSATRLAGQTPALSGFEGVLARLQSSLDTVEQKQTATLSAIEEKYDGKVRRIRGVFADLGINAGRLPDRGGVGGPFVPVKGSLGSGGFEKQIQRINLARAQAESLTRRLNAIPIRNPLFGSLDTSSGFGVRPDPFLGRPAMHTGQDFRGSSGDPVRATANGTVKIASWHGGYGRMIEIDHGGGMATRYAHLSAIDVKVGQSIRMGQVIGKLGSTGRSTGPHLHYETRIGGDAVNPMKYIRAGLRIGNI